MARSGNSRWGSGGSRVRRSAIALVAFSLSLPFPLAASAESALSPRGGTPTVSEPSHRAAARYQEGVRAYAARRYKDAIDCFREADSLAPSAALSFNTALAYDKLLDTDGALSHYREYLRRDPQASRADGVRERIRELQAALARRGVQQMTVQSDPPGATVVIDDKPQGVTPWTGVLEPGWHALRLRLPGYSEVAQRFALPLDHAVAFAFPLRKAQEPLARSSDSSPVAPQHTALTEQRARFPWPWLFLGGSAASFLTAGAFELMRESAETRAKSQTTQVGYEDAFSDAEAHRTSARIFAGIGGGLALTGGVLLFALRPKATESRRAALTCDTQGCFGSWRTAF